MGPRFCKRGNETGRLRIIGKGELQWGHAFVSVETDAAATAGLGAMAGFNGATLL